MRAIAGRSKQPETRATVDQDATIIESHKREALWTYEGTRGYQPMVALWAETQLILADEFRDGNVPAQSSPLTCAQAAFAALPDTVTLPGRLGVPRKRVVELAAQRTARRRPERIDWLCRERADE